MTYRVLLRDNLTGEVRAHVEPSDWNREESAHIWRDGNYGCDCNRAALFARVAGEQAGHVNCGTKRYTAICATLPSGACIVIDDGRDRPE